MLGGGAEGTSKLTSSKTFNGAMSGWTGNEERG